MPRLSNSLTPPVAKSWALRQAKAAGSSMTRFAPFFTAAPARCHLSSRANSPRWVMLPLMQAIMPQSCCFLMQPI
ncbi:MAG: hypothetical protein IIX05_04820 [Selenomonadaceae bacterium]|nr:hypothetical protein [Selenomonadaceae bacterium]